MIDYVIYVVTWDQLVMQCFLVVCLGYPTRNLNFLYILHTRLKAIQTLLKARVYTEKPGAHNPERATSILAAYVTAFLRTSLFLDTF